MKKIKKQKGFSLLEILIALVLISVLSALTLDLLAPWLSFKSKLETQARMEQIREAVSAAYNDRAFRIDSNIGNQLELEAGTNLFPSIFRANPDVGGTDCVSNLAPLARWTRLDPEVLKRDGYGNEFCIEIFGGYADTIDGYRLPYHQIVVYSTGRNGRRDLVPVADPVAGTLTVDLSNGTADPADDLDDLVMVISGFEVQKKKYDETKSRIDKMASMHETFFVQRFLSNPTRDVSINYFCRATDGAAGFDNLANSEGVLNPLTCVAPGDWESIGTSLAGLGFSEQSIEARSAWEETAPLAANNSIQMTNRTGTQNGMTVQSPQNGDSPPYTVLYRTRLPGVDAGGNPSFYARLVAGRY